jgi:hypothetical protein
MKTFEDLKDLHFGCEGVLLGSGPSLAISAERVKKLQELGVLVYGNNHSMFCEEKIGLSIDYHVIGDKMMFHYEPIFKNYLKYNPNKQKLLALNNEQFYFSLPKMYKISKSEFEETFVKVPCDKTTVKFKINGEENTGWSPMNLTSLESTIQIMLYCGIKKIYLAGVDCSPDGNMFYTYGNKGSKDPRNSYLHMKKVWIGIKPYLKKFWPDVEVFSINPVGLKGLFKDL